VISTGFIPRNKMNSSTMNYEVLRFVPDSDFFSPVYELGPAKIIVCCLSFLFSIILVPFLFSIVWFDWYGSDLKRIFINRLVSSIALCSIGQLILVQIPEIFRYMTGPLPVWFCFMHYVLKNTTALLQIIYFDIIAIVRYLFIFHLKNPAMFQDEFWNLFINMQVVSFSFLSQLIFAYLPGRQPLIYYYCTGENPSG
jgi:hypothetical protein